MNDLPLLRITRMTNKNDVPKGYVFEADDGTRNAAYTIEGNEDFCIGYFSQWQGDLETGGYVHGDLRFETVQAADEACQNFASGLPVDGLIFRPMGTP